MKVLILSSKTGEGHNSASKSVAEYLTSQGCETVLMDILKSGKKNVSGSVSSSYNFITTYIPWLFGLLYYIGAAVSSNKHHSPIYYLNSLYSRRLIQTINEIKPDIILCPHIFSGQAITYLKLKHDFKIPAVGLITDYTCSPFWEETRLEKYIIPSKALTEEFAKKGIPESKIIPIGIPVSACFIGKTPKEEARAVFGLKAKHIFVIMGGSMGCGRMPKLAYTVLRRITDAQVVCVCGNNKSLYKKLINKHKENIVVLGFIDNISVLMDAADVLLTKPGGLSSTEAITKQVPLVFTQPLPGGEQRNAKLLCALGAAVSEKNLKKAAIAAIRLVNEPERAERMLKAQQENFYKDVNARVGNLLMDMCRQKVNV
jgi:processive 1,2-diacylglycerol beta-glucosyltransferase